MKAMEALKPVSTLKKEQISERKGVSIVTVEDPHQGLLVAKDILYREVNDATNLFLSGGSTPKDLYRQLAEEAKIMPKAVALVDERADGSNFEMIEETGLVDYLKSKEIKSYPIFTQHHIKGLSLCPNGVLFNNREYTYLEWVAREYEKWVNSILLHYNEESQAHAVAVMGIGEDGHTASIPAKIKNSKLKIQNYVTEVNDFPIEPRERITLTFKALEGMDLLVVLAFGQNKKEALKKMFEEGPLEEIPARFYTRPEIAKKTILITDQKI